MQCFRSEAGMNCLAAIVSAEAQSPVYTAPAKLQRQSATILIAPYGRIVAVPKRTMVFKS
jgi:hypothetical protein